MTLVSCRSMTEAVFKQTLLNVMHIVPVFSVIKVQESLLLWLGLFLCEWSVFKIYVLSIIVLLLLWNRFRVHKNQFKKELLCTLISKFCRYVHSFVHCCNEIMFVKHLQSIISNNCVRNLHSMYTCIFYQNSGTSCSWSPTVLKKILVKYVRRKPITYKGWH